MSKNIPLSKMQHGIGYTIQGFNGAAINYAEKLTKMGFVQGTEVALAPVQQADPIVVQIRGSRVALRKNEASLILVQGV